MKFKILKFLGKTFSIKNIRKTLDFSDYYIGGVIRGLEDEHIFLGAAGIAFSLLVSIIPIILLTFSVLGHIISPAKVEQQVTTLIHTIIPYQEPANYVKTFILKRIPKVIQYKKITAYIGSFGLLFTSTWLFSSIRTVLNNVYKVTKHKSAWIGLLRDFGMVLLLILLVLVTNFIVPTLNFLIKLADQLEPLQVFRLSEFQDVLLGIISTLLIFALFFVFYYLIPYENLGKKVPLLSALWATILWKVAEIIFGYYIGEILPAEGVYGAFILIAAIIFWIFYASILFVVGAKIGQLYRERRSLPLKIKNSSSVNNKSGEKDEK
jgi:membrane protein